MTEFKTLKMNNIYQYNNAVLTDEERKDLEYHLDEIQKSFCKSIDGMYAILEEIKNKCSESHPNRIQLEIGLFTTYTFCDCVVLLKYFISAKYNYEKSLFRGKLQILLNEGFKKLYGFNEKMHRDSHFYQLGLLISKCPKLEEEYNAFKKELEYISNQDTWWKKERNAEVHLDIHQIHKMRTESINESKVAIETIRLTSILLSINDFADRINFIC